MSLNIIVTPAAITYLKATLPSDAIGIHLGTKEAGCNGFKYVLEPAMQKQTDYQLVFDAEGLQVYVDQKSLPYLGGVQIDCVQEGLNKVIKFSNPNETGSCGCGESFSV